MTEDQYLKKLVEDGLIVSYEEKPLSFVVDIKGTIAKTHNQRIQEVFMLGESKDPPFRVAPPFQWDLSDGERHAFLFCSLLDDSYIYNDRDVVAFRGCGGHPLYNTILKDQNLTYRQFIGKLKRRRKTKKSGTRFKTLYKKVIKELESGGFLK